jgi:precorrin-6B methylase 2
MKTCVDLGCGTGVLPIVLSENGDYEGKVYSIDSLPNAIKATEINSQVFGLKDRQKSVELDLVDLYFKPPKAGVS